MRLGSDRFDRRVFLYRAGDLTGVPIALLVFGVPWALFFAHSLLGGGSDEALFDTAAVGFFLSAMIYLGLHGLRNMAWTSVPVLLTFEALIGFVAIPLFGLAMGYDILDALYTKAMLLTLLGFVAFWAGSILLRGSSGIRFSPRVSYTSRRVNIVAASMLVLGVIGNLVLWRTGLFAYAADPILRASYSGILQWMNFLSELLIYALLIAAIEVFGKQSSQRFIRSVLGIALTCSVGFGAISGMKSGPIRPLLYLFLVYVITRQRIPRTAVLLPLILFGLIYPFVTAFRINLNSGYRAQFNTLQGVEDTVSQSFNDAFRTFGAASNVARQESLQETAGRLSYLSYVRDIISLPDAEMLNGDEKVWLAPLYPLVPRFLWPEKPIFNKGQRLSELLGRGELTSSALTPIGDLYALYGIYGVATGMFIWGACLQLYVNYMSATNLTERALLIYVIMLPQLINFEFDSTMLVAGSVQLLLVASLVSFLVYGPLRLQNGPIARRAFLRQL